MRLLWAIAIGILLVRPGWSQEDGSLAGPEPTGEATLGTEEAAWDWQPGDLIFRNGINEIDEALKRTLGLGWASVGMLRPSSGGPRVVFVDPSRGVTEEMLYAHVDGLSADGYAVYRLRDLNPGHDPETDVMTVGPMVGFALSIAYGAPQDRHSCSATARSTMPSWSMRAP